MSTEVRTYRPRPWGVIVLAVVLAVAGAGRPPTVVVGPVTDTAPGAAPGNVADPARRSDRLGDLPGRPGPAAYPATGRGRFNRALGGGPVFGESGPVLRFRVGVESDISGVDLDDFAAEVVATLSDPQGWTAGGRWRFQWTADRAPADVTVDLATPGTADRLCRGRDAAVGACRVGDRVLVDVARWLRGLPSSGAPVAEYRQYLVNHAVGHRLGHDHVERCPGAGRAAPVMQQQLGGLDGCRPNPWPYPVDGHDTGGPA